MTCPAFTSLLKSARISTTCPESCEPTITVVVGVTVPVDETEAMMFPRCTRSVRYRCPPSPGSPEVRET